LVKVDGLEKCLLVAGIHNTVLEVEKLTELILGEEKQNRAVLPALSRYGYPQGQELSLGRDGYLCVHFPQ
jgi:hypothetical protein